MNTPRRSLFRRLRFETLERRELLATLTVNTILDENDGAGVGGLSLRDAIAAAMPADTIDFDPALTSGGPATILLQHGELLIDKSLTITGPGAALLTIDAQQNSRVFNIDNGNFGYQQEVTLERLTITGGRVTVTATWPNPADGGGGIRSVARLTLSDSVVTGNTVAGNEFGAGGGIFIPGGSGQTTITGSTISGNAASGDGGGLFSWASATIDNCTIADNASGANGGGVRGYATITNSTIADNAAVNGGGAHGDYGLWIRDSTISGNTASADGGGTWGFSIDGCSVSNNTAGGNGGGVHGGIGATVINSTITYNTASGNGGGVSVATIDRCTISNNTAEGDGGGVHNGSVTSSTIIDNAAVNGGGIAECGAITNSTIARNTADNHGGGVYENDGAAIWVRHSTITDNSAVTSGGGLYSGGPAPVLSHVLLAGNDAPANPDLNFTTISLSYSLIGDNSGTTLTPAPVGMPDASGNLIGTAAEPIDPLLGPLADNGGPTLTYALLIGSPAIDAGDPAARPGEGTGNNAVPFYDQRGEPFLRVREIPSTRPTAIDIGAYEVPGLVRGDYNGNRIADAADYVAWRKFDGLSGLPPYSTADGNGDGNIDHADYDVWHTTFAGAELLQTRAFVGTLQDDVLAGTEFDDGIFGLAGNDTVNAGGGDDYIDGGGGIDHLYGEAGNDVIIGGPGNDTFIDGGLGDDILEGGLGADRYRFSTADFGHDEVNDIGGSLGDRVNFTFSFTGVEFFGLDLHVDTNFDALFISRDGQTITIKDFFDNTISNLSSLSDANKGTGYIELFEAPVGWPNITGINDLKLFLQDGRPPGAGAMTTAQSHSAKLHAQTEPITAAKSAEVEWPATPAQSVLGRQRSSRPLARPVFMSPPKQPRITPITRIPSADPSVPIRAIRGSAQESIANHHAPTPAAVDECFHEIDQLFPPYQANHG